MYRLVASDMDETFLDSNHAIPEANIRALKRMKELGGSARPLKRALVLVDAQRQRSGGMDLARRPQTRGKAAKERALVQGHAQRRGGLSREDRARARPTSGQSRALPRQRRGRVAEFSNRIIRKAAPLQVIVALLSALGVELVIIEFRRLFVDFQQRVLYMQMYGRRCLLTD